MLWWRTPPHWATSATCLLLGTTSWGTWPYLVCKPNFPSVPSIPPPTFCCLANTAFTFSLCRKHSDRCFPMRCCWKRPRCWAEQWDQSPILCFSRFTWKPLLKQFLLIFLPGRRIAPYGEDYLPRESFVCTCHLFPALAPCITRSVLPHR